MSESYRPNESILLSGGKGKRMHELTQDRLPKSLVSVNGKTLLQYSIDHLKPQIIKAYVFALDHHADQIQDWVIRQNFPQKLMFSYQKDAGVALAIQSASLQVKRDEMTTCNSDEIRLQLPLEEILATSIKQMQRGKLATMVVTHANHLHRHRMITLRETDGHVISTRLKPREYLTRSDDIGLVNTGFFILAKRALEYLDFSQGRDWNALIEPLCDAGLLGAHLVPNMPFFNVGTMEEYNDAVNFFNTSHK